MMKKYEPKFKTGSLFICQKCGQGFDPVQPDLAEKIKTQARQILKEKNLNQEVRVMVSGCLGVCADNELTFAYYPNQGAIEMQTTSAQAETALQDIVSFVESKVK